MHKVTVWDQMSTNFNANGFVKRNGTDTIETESKATAHQIMGEAMRMPSVVRAIIEGPEGRLSWVRSQFEDCGPDECDCDDCQCDEDGCCEGGCDGCSCDDDKDDEGPGFDVNDPRR